LIPLATTTFTVTRLEVVTDPNSLEDLDSETDLNLIVATNVVIATGLRAYIDGGEGTRTFGAGGEKEHVVFKFRTDLIAGDTIQGDDVLTDASGQIYNVLWCRQRNALGLGLIEGQCFQETGEQ
jgi:hypothetical protein